MANKRGERKRITISEATKERWYHRGAAQQILASVLRTAHQRQLDVHALVVSMLRAPRPTVLLEFSGRAQ